MEFMVKVKCTRQERMDERERGREREREIARREGVGWDGE